MTSVDRLHSNQVLSTRGFILSFSWCFTDVASITFGFFSSGSYPCFLFLSWQNIIMFTLIESGRQAIKGIMIVQLSSNSYNMSTAKATTHQPPQRTYPPVSTKDCHPSTKPLLHTKKYSTNADTVTLYTTNYP